MCKEEENGLSCDWELASIVSLYIDDNLKLYKPQTVLLDK